MTSVDVDGKLKIASCFQVVRVILLEFAVEKLKVCSSAKLILQYSVKLCPFKFHTTDIFCTSGAIL